ncbi:hypothetical protein CEXT_167121 [Caerostris extrusa]|uniref:Uncharacterized protein n=1 Tax=Caerostris extrusa TaxID=172846 RepID=A0AAV4XBL3_CAEEX|nr:hypothetical protein CEXT_167121 [Caerostris extrusa]
MATRSYKVPQLRLPFTVNNQSTLVTIYICRRALSNDDDNDRKGIILAGFSCTSEEKALNWPLMLTQAHSWENHNLSHFHSVHTICW